MSETKLAITDGCVVGILYTLKDDAGETLQTNRDTGEELFYLHGADNIVPGLERALAGKTEGADVVVIVAPEDGYGELDEDLVQEVGRDEFPDDVEPEPGMAVSGETDDGTELNGVIAVVDEDTVTVDFNHPLAGENLHFEVTVTGVREASADELSHGHPHGPGGHHHH